MTTRNRGEHIYGLFLVLITRTVSSIPTCNVMCAMHFGTGERPWKIIMRQDFKVYSLERVLYNGVLV